MDGSVRGPQRVLLSHTEEWTWECGAPLGSEFLDMSTWFRLRPPRRASIDREPRTNLALSNGFDIYFDAQPGRRGITNASIELTYGLKWPGNVIVVKRSRRDDYTAAHITAAEVSLVGILVHE